MFVTEQKGDCSFLIFLLKVDSIIVAQMHGLSRLHGVTYRLILVRSRQVQVPFCRASIMLVFLFTYAYIHIYMYIHIMLYQCISYGTWQPNWGILPSLSGRKVCSSLPASQLKGEVQEVCPSY